MEIRTTFEAVTAVTGDYHLFIKQIKRCADYIIHYAANFSFKPLNTILRYMVLDVLDYEGVSLKLSKSNIFIINTSIEIAIKKAINIDLRGGFADDCFRRDVFKHLLKGASNVTMLQLGITAKREILGYELKYLSEKTKADIQIGYLNYRNEHLRHYYRNSFGFHYQKDMYRLGIKSKAISSKTIDKSSSTVGIRNHLQYVSNILGMELFLTHCKFK